MCRFARLTGRATFVRIHLGWPSCPGLGIPSARSKRTRSAPSREEDKSPRPPLDESVSCPVDTTRRFPCSVDTPTTVPRSRAPQVCSSVADRRWALVSPHTLRLNALRLARNSDFTCWGQRPIHRAFGTQRRPAVDPTVAGMVWLRNCHAGVTPGSRLTGRTRARITLVSGDLVDLAATPPGLGSLHSGEGSASSR